MSIECISLFSGAGGLDHGAKCAGVDVTHFIENDGDCIETLKLNNSHSSEILKEDVSDFPFKKLKTKKKQIVIGGPPCQPFSKNGYWVKNSNRKIDLDPRNMIDQYVRSVDGIKPSGFLFENVESMLHPTNINTTNKFLRDVKAIGYRTLLYKANALDFGVPQKRKRIFIFGVKNKNVNLFEPGRTHADPNSIDLLTSNLPSHKNVGEFIKEFRFKKYSETYEDASKGTYYKELCAVVPGKNYMCLTELDNYDGKTFEKGKRFWNFLYKLSPDEPSITIAAQPGPWVGPFHWDNRRLRVPEIAAIQTFPKNYKFFGSRRSVQKQIGNAVPCLLGQRMVEHLIDLVT